MLGNRKTKNNHSWVDMWKSLSDDRSELQKVKEKQENTLASINYARRIQDAILIDREELFDIFGEFTIVYEPKDIVSGDFYYAKESGAKKMLVVGDCTGHGVPGAFMSILCNDLLIRAMKKHCQPNEILNRVNELLIKRLNHGREDAICDGMDAGVALIDYETMKLKYAGAMNIGLLISQDGTMKVLASTRKSIGKCYGDENFKGFDLFEVSFNKNDMLYLFSDGYKDQFNSKGQKLGKNKFLELLLSAGTMDIAKQNEFLNTFFQQHKKDTEQVDDVLVLGVRL